MMISKTSLRLLCAAPVALCASVAIAGGLADPIVPVPVAPPPPPVSADWTGPYIGAQVGSATATIVDADEDYSGTIYGVHAGYLYDFGSIVAGAELDYDLTNISEPIAVVGAGTIDLEVDYVARAKLRVGFDAGAVMPYLVGGVAQMQVTTVDEVSDTGTFFGAGLDYQLNPSVRIGAEFLQHQFEEFDDGSDIDVTTIALRASYTF